MKRTIFVLVLVLVSATLFAQAPEEGVYVSTDMQWEWHNEELIPISPENQVTFSIGIPSTRELWLRWDYDDDGRLDDEATEQFATTYTPNGLFWRESEVEYLAWKEGGHYAMMLSFDDGTTYVVNLEQVSTW